ncbi:GNAT family N-acetyltransferase [Nocardioides sp. zg-578]|nr:GNAT family N-acetyltransferase [Nocardioides marmotae]
MGRCAHEHRYDGSWPPPDATGASPSDRGMVAGVAGGATGDDRVVLETERLLLRPWRVEEASVQRELWIERDPRVPPHRRIDADGHPTLAELEEAIRADEPSSLQLLAVELKAGGDPIGYCGLVQGAHGPELAFELLRRSWGQGYATEASWAVLDRARSAGHERLWASVWDWNTASRRVLAKAGFMETAREKTVHGTNLVMTRPL